MLSGTEKLEGFHFCTHIYNFKHRTGFWVGFNSVHMGSVGVKPTNPVTPAMRFDEPRIGDRQTDSTRALRYDNNISDLL